MKKLLNMLWLFKTIAKINKKTMQNKQIEELAKEAYPFLDGMTDVNKVLYCNQRLAFIAGYQSAMPKWISVEDEKPKQTLNHYLCALKNGMVVIATYHINNHWQLLFTMKDIPKENPITHWMPLPQNPL